MIWMKMSGKQHYPDIKYRLMIIVTCVSILTLSIGAVWQCRLVVRQIEAVKNDTYMTNISGKQRFYGLKFFFVLYQMITSPGYRLTPEIQESMKSDLIGFTENHEIFIHGNPNENIQASVSEELKKLLYEHPYEYDRKHRDFETKFLEVLSDKFPFESPEGKATIRQLLEETYALIQSKDTLNEQYISDSRMRYKKIYSQMLAAGGIFLLILGILAVFGFVPMRRRIRRQMRHLKDHADILEHRTEELEELREVILSILQDTQIGRKRAEAAEHETREYARKLEYSNQELENFAHVASHDLKEPLRKIKVFGDMLVQDAHHNLNAKQQDYIRRMQKSAERMQQLIEGLLDYSSVTHTAPQMEWVDLNRVISGVLSDFDIKIQESGAEIMIANLPSVRADRLRMRQLFQNLLSNSFKYCSKDRILKIEIQAEQRGSDWINIHVTDNGIGLDQIHAEKIFKPFERLHGRKDYEGSGIGLAICKRIAMSLGGDISVKSRPGAGSTFTIKLRYSDAVKYEAAV